MKNLSLFSLVVLVLVIATPAKAADDRDFIAGAALLSIADHWCSDSYKVDLKAISLVLAGRKINVTKGKHNTLFNGYLDMARTALSNMGVDAFCDKIYSDFGHADYPLIIKR